MKEKNLDQGFKKAQEQGARRYDYWLFVPALLLPLIGTCILPYIPFFENKNATLGIIFVSTGMGDQISKLLSIFIALDNAFAAFLVWCKNPCLF